MIVRYIMCAELASVDVFSNKISMFNIIEEINSPSFPVSVPSLAVIVGASKQENDPREINSRVIFEINGERIASYEMSFAFEDVESARAIGSVQGFFIPAPGQLVMRIETDAGELARWTVPCRQVGQPELRLNT